MTMPKFCVYASGLQYLRKKEEKSRERDVVNQVQVLEEKGQGDDLIHFNNLFIIYLLLLKDYPLQYLKETVAEV